MQYITLIQYGLTLLLLAGAGLLAGFFGAFFGVGGGTILVPCFLVIFSCLSPHLHVDMHQAIGTSLALVIANTITATKRHYKAGNLPLAFFRGWAVWLFIGAVIGGLLMAYIPSVALKFLFAFYLVIATIYQACKNPNETHTATQYLPHGLAKSGGGLVFGALSTLLGVAGGTFVTPFLTYFNCPLRKAMAISVAGAIIIGVVGTVTAITVGWGMPNRLPWSLGYVQIFSVIVVMPFIMLSSPWGVKASNRTPLKLLHWLYVAFLLFLTAYMIYEIVLDLC